MRFLYRFLVTGSYIHREANIDVAAVAWMAVTRPAYDYLTVTCAIKVSSTESGTIFGNIVYGSASGADSTVIALNSIHMDIADYIKPVYCTDRAFRASWAELEWENKLSVSTDLKDLNEYLQHILKITNMALLTRDALAQWLVNGGAEARRSCSVACK